MSFLRTTSAVLLCAAVAVAQSGAVLSGPGRVLVNDLESRSAALVSGDRILTGDEAFASITEPGSQVILAKQTSSTMDSHKLVLNQGHASVTTTNTYPVQAGPFTVTPQAASAHYEVTRLNCRVTVTAHDTALNVSDGGVVKPGHSFTRVVPNCVADNAPATAGSTSQAANPSMNAVAGVGIVSGSLLAAYLASGQSKASPSSPHR